MLWISVMEIVVLWLVLMMLNGNSMVLIMEWVDLNIGMIDLSVVSWGENMWLDVVVLSVLINMGLWVHVAFVVSVWSLV